MKQVETVEADEIARKEKSVAYLELGMKYLYGNSTVERNFSRAILLMNEVRAMGHYKNCKYFLTYGCLVCVIG